MTLRELLWMAEGRGRSAWSHTAEILAMLANTHRDPKKRAVKSGAFNPYAQEKEASKPVAKTKGLMILKSVFVDKKQ